MAETVRVNFSRPMPLFPLHGLVLLPHAVQPLHIFEPRYRQMVDDTLGASRQIAMACFDSASPRCTGGSVLRPAVCVGQIIQHERLEDGRHNIVLHGVCRAAIREMMEPSCRRPYRMARLAPLEVPALEPPRLERVRLMLQAMLANPELRRMRSVRGVLAWFKRGDVPTHALLELLGFTLVYDPETRYRLLAEPNVMVRAGVIAREIRSLTRVLVLAERQSYARWDKGQSWN
jgi:Lon protease-like protein